MLDLMTVREVGRKKKKKRIEEEKIKDAKIASIRVNWTDK